MKFRRGKKEGIISPERRTGIRGGGENNLNTFVITTEVVKRGLKVKGNMSNIHKNMVQASVNTWFILTNTMEGVVRSICPREGSVRKRGKEGKKMRP
jgi:hypothetical protein